MAHPGVLKETKLLVNDLNEQVNLTAEPQALDLLVFLHLGLPNFLNFKVARDGCEHFAFQNFSHELLQLSQVHVACGLGIFLGDLYLGFFTTLGAGLCNFSTVLAEFTFLEIGDELVHEVGKD